ALAHGEAEEPVQGVDGARHRAGGEALPAQAPDELGEVGLPEGEDGPPARPDPGAQAGEVGAVSGERARGERALHAEVVEVLPLDRAGHARARARRRTASR